jgi:hypothetical protein
VVSTKLAEEPFAPDYARMKHEGKIVENRGILMSPKYN